MKTIWYDKENEVNSYAECVSRFCYDDGECYADISADGEFELYINGKFAANGQYPDYPFYKVYERVDISEFCVKGENVIAVRAYHDGLKNSSVWYPKTAGVAFRVFSGETVLSESDENTLVRKSLVYKSGDMEVITNQLGYSYKADLTKEDDWKTRIGCDGFVNAEVKDADYTFNPRPIKRCSLSSPLESKAVMQGYFVEAGGDLPSLKAQNALLGFVRFSDMTGKDKIKFADKPVGFACEKGDGIYAVYDLGRETTGYLNFDITVEEDADMIVAYGEHLSDGRVRAEVGLRNFAFSVKLKKGKNVFSNYIRRLGLRYLQVYIYAHKATIDKLTVREYFYPVEELPKKFNDKLVEKIYETGVRTLRLCMHEHYEDCPWREQALYAMDSRNQMLFGINQGGTYDDIRIGHMQDIAALDLDGYAIGGLAVGESAEEMYRIIDAVEPYMPENKPRYLMGVGTPINILEAVWRGVDFFDCVMPSRNARHGTIFTWKGTVNVNNQKYMRDPAPIDPDCGCPACRNYSKAYIRHLLRAGEMLGMRLCVLHNLYFYNELMAKIRDAIDGDYYEEFYRKYIDILGKRI